MPLTPPSTLFTPSPTRLILSAAYHPYARIVPSQHASDAAPPSLPPPILTRPHPHRLQSLCSCGALKICLRPTLNPPYTFSHPPITILTLLVSSRHAYDTAPTLA
ncbi:hypothetical protein O181_019188 [Austropuccinia psidii MF-1]|uniref:Uncharacterized protein n=1 Tax=Austropuccinia psidii MF-1 TaxID=1389203 RepID=A0A9Q3CAH1_9BASI|nr:hypothetical protein [Austropuccinia psidii MF-1]